MKPEPLTFDEESSDRPHLDRQLQQERKMVEDLRRELEVAWKHTDEGRERSRRIRDL